ncbi:MAG: glycosyltransferase family 2 protein [Actinomycetota bacterium]
MNEPTAAPPVVAVVVTRDGGPWLAETLAALAAQDHPRLAVLVLDNGGEIDPTPVVAEHLPQAVVRRLTEDRGYGAAANRVAGLVEGAAFYLFCHDDVAPEPDAVSVMVDEALRSNAGIVGPKLVGWDDPRSLQAVGATADITGVGAPLVEPGELDQEQHDRVRDVLWIPGAMTLVRADLFDELGGFDETITYLGEDLDLCWRAHVAGARVLVAPDAAARHLEALGERREVDDRRRLQHRHRIRTLLAVSGRLRLLLVVPLALLLTLAEATYGLVAGGPRHARDVIGAWWWNLRRPRQLLAKRRQIRPTRQVSDAELAHLQMRGSARLRAFVRGQINRDDRLTSIGDAGRSLASSLTVGAARTAALAWVIVLLTLGVATRHLMTRGMPPFREFLALPGGSQLREVVTSGYRDSWLGTEVEPPLGPLLVGLLDLLPGTTALLRTVLVLGPIVLGLIGTWRLLTPLASRRASIVGLVVAASSPLPAAALSGGSWTVLVVWASVPWILARLGRISGIEPFTVGRPGGRRGAKRLRSQVAGLALLLAVAAAAAPVLLPISLGLAVALVAGSLISGSGVMATLRTLGITVVASLWAGLLHAPWIAGLVDDRPPWSLLVGRDLVEGTDGLGALLRADLGPVGHVLLGWGPLAIALVPLALGREWRLGWSIRAAVIWAAAVGVAWVEARGWSGDVVLPDPAVLLAVAAPAAAMSAGLAVSTYERDLRDYRFGWRQLVLVIGAAGVVVTPLPALATLPDGRFEVPVADLAASAGFLDDDSAVTRVMWVGQAEVLPMPGLRVRDDVHVAVSAGFPDLRDAWPAHDDQATDPGRAAVGSLLTGSSARFGELLAPLGVRYVVVVESAAPSFTETPRLEAPADLIDRLEQQLDLRLVPTDPAMTVFRNEAFVPVEAIVPSSFADLVEAGPDGLTSIDPATIRPAVVSVEVPVPDGETGSDGETESTIDLVPAAVAADESVYVARVPSGRFGVDIDGRTAPAEVYASGQLAAAGGGGEVVIERSDPGSRRIMLGVLALVWLVTWWLAARGWSAEGRAVTQRLLEQAERADPIARTDGDDPDRGLTASPRRGPRRPRRRRRAPEPAGAGAAE